jgi:hypothetical protein
MNIVPLKNKILALYKADAEQAGIDAKVARRAIPASGPIISTRLGR